MRRAAATPAAALAGPRRLPVAAVLVAPAVAMMVLLALYPVAFGVWAGFHQWNWSLGQAESWSFIGLKNFVAVVRDKKFLHSIGVTLHFTVLAVLLELGLGLLLALYLWRIRVGAAIYRSAIIFPLMVSDIVAAVIASVMLEPTLGPINALLGGLGLPRPNWIGDPDLVVPVLAVVDAWWQTGSIVLILLAGLSGIPEDRIEMASIDGARGWSMLRYIVLPAILPFILVALVFRSIDALRVFSLAWAVTKGGPGRATEVTQLYVYELGVGRFFNMGYASAAATVFALLITLVAGVYVMAMRRTRQD